SVAPASMIDPSARPTKVDRASDVTGLVDTGELATLFTGPTAVQDAVSVLEAMTRISHHKADLATFESQIPPARLAELRTLHKCGYVKSTYLAEAFPTPSVLNPDLDPVIVGPTGIFTQAE